MSGAIYFVNQIRIFLNKKERSFLSKLQEIFNYFFFCNYFRVLFFWLIRHILIILNFKQDSCFFPIKKKLVWILRNIKFLIIFGRFFFSWFIKQDSFHLEFQSRIFFLSSWKESHLNFKIKKNLLTKKSKNLERTSTSEENV
jgi:hypothetical protein